MKDDKIERRAFGEDGKLIDSEQTKIDFRNWQQSQAIEIRSKLAKGIRLRNIERELLADVQQSGEEATTSEVSEDLKAYYAKYEKIIAKYKK